LIKADDEIQAKKGRSGYCKQARGKRENHTERMRARLSPIIGRSGKKIRGSREPQPGSRFGDLLGRKFLASGGGKRRKKRFP